MAKTLSSMKTKEQTHIKIFNFYISKKTLVIVGIAIVILFIIIKYNQAQKDKELQERIMAQSANYEVANTTTYEDISIDEQIQRQLREKFGNPPEGFKWNYFGELEPIPDIEDATAEDIVYTYLQSLHMMDLATAQRVASKSSIINLVDNYYSEVGSALISDKDEYQRKLLRLTLDKMSVDGISNTIVQADGTYIFSVDITCLDLSNKNFWRKDEQELYKTMFVYDKTETDSVKKAAYLYDYIYDAYTKELCGFKTATVDIIVGKTNQGGWLVRDDTSLRRLLLYEDGTGLHAYILSQYTDWCMREVYQSSVGGGGSDVGFGYSDADYDAEAVERAENSASTSVTDAQLQAELEYYKEHGELPPKSNSNSETDTNSNNAENTNSTEDTNAEGTNTQSETSTTTSSSKTENSGDKTELHIEPIWDAPDNHSLSQGAQVGYEIVE